MKVKVHAKDFDIANSTEERIGDKLANLEKYGFIDENTTASVQIKKAGNRIKLEITIPSKIGTLRSEVEDIDIKSATDKSIDKLEGQIRRQKTRLSRKHRDKLSKAFLAEIEAAEPAEEKISKVKRIVSEEMDSDEAIIQMELTGHDFFVYTDSTTKLTCVMYRRHDGNYGILEVA